ncbi:MAG TPA: DUF4389 domain-containing protein [Mycobacteriales bacterium]
MTTLTDYPVHVEARLDPPLSRWLWLVKWVLAVPHYIVLAVLWMAFGVLSVVAFFAILITGRYPRSIFDFNVGVLRWTWRVQYYAFGALATDRYPPFTLAEVPDYPAHLQIDYPEHLSRGLVLVKWWLLAIPHYLVVGLFVGGGSWLAWRADTHSLDWTPGGLIGIVVLIAGVTLAVTGRYPQQLYDFVLGMDRWVLRVAAYAGLMTDKYPPFRFDMGGHESGGTLVVPPPTAPTGSAATASAAPTRSAGSGQSLTGEDPTGGGWTAGRVVSVVAGSILAFGGLGAVAAGGTGLWFDQHREGGYVMSTLDTQRSSGYAITSDRIELYVPSSGWQWSRDLIGTVRMRVTGATSDAGTFVGIAPTDEVDRYLSGVSRTVLADVAGHRASTVDGGAPATPPAQTPIWVARSSGPGTQVLTWEPRSGDWTVVVMNADAARGLSVRGDVGLTVPMLTEISIGLLAGGIVLVAVGALLVVIPVRRASGNSRTTAQPGEE